jgi:serine/threonine-protein kinase
VGTIGEARDQWGAARIHRPSGRIVAELFDSAAGGTDLWLIDPRSNVSDRLTLNPGVEASGVWSPDGTRIVYGDAQTTPPKLRSFTLGQRGAVSNLPADRFQLPTDWSPDGKWIVYQTSGSESEGAEVWVASTLPDGKIYPILKQQGFGYYRAVFSPNGKYIAFGSTESGRPEVYIQAFDSGVPPRVTGERRRASVNGGRSPRWSGNGRELFFTDQSLGLYGIEVREPLSLSPPVHLFDIGPATLGMYSISDSYEVDLRGRDSSSSNAQPRTRRGLR